MQTKTVYGDRDHWPHTERGVVHQTADENREKRHSPPGQPMGGGIQVPPNSSLELNKNIGPLLVGY